MKRTIFRQVCLKIVDAQPQWSFTEDKQNMFISRSFISKKYDNTSICFQSNCANDGDPSCIQYDSRRDCLVWDITICFDILFSQTLYFNITENSTILRLDEVLSVLPGDNYNPLDDRFGLVIGQNYHPFHEIPYFFIHPCKNADFESKDSLKSILLWISIMQQVLGIEILTLNDVKRIKQ
jgi:hypothetical protein